MELFLARTCYKLIEKVHFSYYKGELDWNFRKYQINCSLLFLSLQNARKINNSVLLNRYTHLRKLSLYTTRMFGSGHHSLWSRVAEVTSQICVFHWGIFMSLLSGSEYCYSAQNIGTAYLHNAYLHMISGNLWIYWMASSGRLKLYSQLEKTTGGLWVVTVLPGGGGVCL